MSIEGYPVGSTPTVTAHFRVNEALTDPTTVSATVEDPAGAETTPTPQKVSTGIYAVTFLADQAGIWHYRIVGNSPAPGVVEGDVLIVTSPVLDSYPAPPYTYDLATDIGKVRLYIDDRDISSVAVSTPRERRSCIFDDLEIAQFIAGEGSVYGAAATALRTIATNRALLVQRRDLDGAVVDYGSLRKDLMDAAAAWDEKADELAGGLDAPADGVAEVNWDEFSERRIVVNAQLRQGF